MLQKSCKKPFDHLDGDSTNFVRAGHVNNQPAPGEVCKDSAKGNAVRASEAAAFISSALCTQARQDISHDKSQHVWAVGWPYVSLLVQTVPVAISQQGGCQLAPGFSTPPKISGSLPRLGMKSPSVA